MMRELHQLRVSHAGAQDVCKTHTHAWHTYEHMSTHTLIHALTHREGGCAVKTFLPLTDPAQD